MFIIQWETNQNYFFHLYCFFTHCTLFISQKQVCLLNSLFFLSDCPFGQRIRQEQIGLPSGVAAFPGSNIATPLFFVGDDAFPLSRRMMKPISGHFLEEPERIYNYRISRARRVIENAFGILVSRFRIFEGKINMRPESVDTLVFAAVCLHILRIKELKRNPLGRFFDVPTFHSEENSDANIPQNADEMQEALKNYFLSPEGQVPWQHDSVNYTPDEWEEFDDEHGY